MLETACSDILQHAGTRSHHGIERHGSDTGCAGLGYATRRFQPVVCIRFVRLIFHFQNFQNGFFTCAARAFCMSSVLVKIESTRSSKASFNACEWPTPFS
jgi:hypothetical protein